MALPLALLGFLLGAVAVVCAGIVLVRSADVIAERTRLGGRWVGSVLLAVVTSLPELTTDLAAVRLGEPDLAAGDLFGSSMANMLILALVSLAPGADLFRRAALENTLTAALAIVLTCTTALVVLLRPEATLLGVGPGSALVALAYLAGTRTIQARHPLPQDAGASVAPLPPETEPRPGDPDSGTLPLRSAALRFAAASAVILVFAPLFAASAQGIADATGLHSSIVGTWLVGLTTSLPELATSWAAVRMRAYDLAVGNLFGSNAVNMAIFVVLDAAYPAGPLLGAVSQVHALSALVAVILMAISLAALFARAERRYSLLEPSSVLIVLAYLIGLGLVFSGSTRG